jgi:predicted amidohydrolase YtcJ
MLALSLLTVQVVLAAQSPPPGVADSILVNGRILVFGGPERHDGAEAPRFEQALAIRDGRIVFIGASEEARRYAGPGSTVTDLNGRTVMPGIVDGHFHGTRYTDCDLGYEGGTIAQVLAKLTACLDRPDQAAYKGTNVRLYARNFFAEALTPRGTQLTREDLDQALTRPARFCFATPSRPQVLAEQPRDRELRRR